MSKRPQTARSLCGRAAWPLAPSPVPLHHFFCCCCQMMTGQRKTEEGWVCKESVTDWGKTTTCIQIKNVVILNTKANA